MACQSAGTCQCSLVSCPFLPCSAPARCDRLDDDAEGLTLIFAVRQADMLQDDPLNPLPSIVRQLGKSYSEDIAFDPRDGGIRQTQRRLSVVQVQGDRDTDPNGRKRCPNDFAAGLLEIFQRACGGREPGTFSASVGDVMLDECSFGIAAVKRSMRTGRHQILFK